MSEQSITTRECLMRDLQDQRDFAMGEMERLKRERDEARELFRTAIELSKKYKDQRDEARMMLEREWHEEGAPLVQMMRERDEAREAFAIATDQCVLAQAELRKP